MRDIQGEFGHSRMNMRVGHEWAQQSQAQLLVFPQTSTNTGILHCWWFISPASEQSVIILPFPHPEAPSPFFFWAKAVFRNTPPKPANSWIKSAGWQLAGFAGDTVVLAVSAGAGLCCQQPVLWEGVRASRPPPLLSTSSRVPCGFWAETPYAFLGEKKKNCPNIRFWCHYSWEQGQLKGERKMYALRFAGFS